MREMKLKAQVAEYHVTKVNEALEAEKARFFFPEQDSK